MSSAKRYFFKVNYQLNQNNRFRTPAARRLLPHPGRASANHRVEHDLGRERSATTLARLPLVVGPQPDDGPGSAGISFYGVDHGDPLERGFPRRPPLLRPRYQPATGGIYSCLRRQEQKTAFSGKVTKCADDFMGGSHDQVGVE
ncbi:MAG: hypothetical protein R2712_04325 [Vicinamibacterales bacterium]